MIPVADKQYKVARVALTSKGDATRAGQYTFSLTNERLKVELTYLLSLIHTSSSYTRVDRHVNYRDKLTSFTSNRA